ncbi:ESPR-type extended signal peptide-containing protein, partial [Burkholderia orbicola]|uniref:ESPR-type extended signal peptide-containing protein n=1 Tax=Burkholderia orbicola TaxID=2978683 RepID=UPI002656D1B2
MNKTYRTVWNATTGTWTAAAETARMRTKSNTTMRSSVTAAVAVMAGVGGGVVAADANAQASNGNGSLTLCSPSGSSRPGTSFGGGNSSGTALTACAVANPIFNNRATSFMLYNNATANGTSTGARGSAGTEAGIQGSTDGHLTLLGGAGVHVIGAADFSANVNMTNHRITGLAAGTAGTDAVNLNQLNSAIAAAKTTANPYVVTNTGTYAAATAARAGSSATAIGANANAAGTSAVALGGNTVASAQNATAIGTLSSATGTESTAIGASARAFGNGSTALGQAAYVDATSTGSLALGQGAAVTRTGANTSNMIAIGTNARAGDAGAGVSTGAIAIGSGANAGGSGSIMIGTNARHSGSNATVVGANSSAMGGGAGTVLGSNSSASGSASVVLGSGATASGANSVALGTGSIANANNTVSVGSAATQRRITNLAAGTANTDAVNVGQMNTALSTKVDNTYIKIDTRNGTAAAQAGSGSVAIGTNTSASGSYATAFGNSARANGDNSTALGFQASSAGGAAVAVGNGANASGSHGVALGVNAVASHTDSVALGALSATDRNNSVSVGSSTLRRQITNVAAGTQETDAVNVGQLNAAIAAGSNPYVAVRGSTAARSSGTQSIAIGDGAIANATDINGGQTNIAIGAKAYTSGGFGQLALGEGASTTNTNAGGAIAIGRGAKTTQRGVALGDGASVTAQYGVALGDTSVADRANSVSVGSATLQRQITNVAAGTQDTDAVNVGQLKDSGLIGDDGKSIAAVTYDRNADGTPNYGTVTLGNGAGPTQIKNVADATDDHDALNLGQLKDAGLVGDDGKGNLTSMAVTYDGAARDKVTLAGADGTTLSNVKAGVANMDAVNVGQLKDSGLIGDDGKSIAAVTYDRNADGTPNYGTVTLGNGAGPTQIKNVADATDDHDALNLGQLKDAGLVGDDGKGNLTSMAVTYDGAAKDSVTLGGVGATTPVAIHNVKDGELSATSKDAVNGSQLFATNTRVGDLEDSLSKGGVIDPVTGESLAVVYDSNTKDTVTLKGADGTTLSNVKAGAADMDAVNVSQLKGSGLIGDDGKSIAAVTYDRNADGTPNYGTVTLGNGAGPTQIKNVATGVDDLDAVNVKQLNTGLSDLRDEMSGGNLRFVKVNADPVTGTPAVASGALAVAIGSDARATSANSLALGSGARVTGNGSVAIGYNSVANQNNVVSVGDVGRERKIVNVADGDVAFQSTDAVNGGQLYAALNDLSTSVSSKTQQAIDSFSSEIDKKTKAAIDEVSSRSMQTMDVSDPLVAIEGLQGNNVASLNGADPATATAAAIGSSTAASGANAVAVGLQSGAGSNNSVAIGSFAQTGAGQDYSVAMGSNVQTNGTQAVALGANAQANGDYALAVGNNGAQAIGDGSIAVGNAANVRAGSTNAIAMGTGANVARGVEGAMALGANTTAGAANSVALGANAFSNRANTVSVGRAGAERQVVNVAAGMQATDAVNVSQLKGMTDALGGGAAVGADGTVTSPTYSLADPADASQSKSYNNVGDALSNLDGRTTTNTQNITVINKQLADSGLVDPVTGQSITAVTYDRNADGTPNLGSVTLGGAGATAPVALKNVADATDDGDALNLGQLKGAGLVGDDGKGNLTSMAVTYDGAAKDKVTLAGADGTTLANVKAGVADMDAVNVSQLKGSGLIGDDGKSIAAVTYDRNADGTPNYGSVTLGNGAGPTQLKNVADATDDGDALNLGQLKDAGLVGDDGAGNLTSMAVTYDGAAKDSITLGGTGATTPVAIHNVKDGELSATSKDAVNGSQLFATNQNLSDLKDSLKDGGVIDPVTGESLAVVYDGNAKDTVTLKGTDGTTLSNVKAGVADMDAVNVSQLKGSGLIGDDGKSIAAVTYDRLADGSPNYGSVTLGNGAGPTQIKNVADATDDHDAINYNQLKQYVADNSGGSGNPLAVGYDDDTKARVTLQGGADGTTITNVKAGAVTATSTDAINGAQLHGTAQSVADSLGGGATVGADGKVTNPTYSLADPADASQSKSYNNVGDALSNLDGR